jgi:group I intron endonuclease
MALNKKQAGIYKIVNANNGKVYVGSAVNIIVRWRNHKAALNAGKHTNAKLQRAWNKYGSDAFAFSMIEEVLDHSQIIAREQHWIDELSAAGRNGYNICPTAGSALGLKRSEETRKKQSIAATGRKMSPESVRATRAANVGRKQSQEEIERRRQAVVGRTLSDEHRKNLSAALKGKKKSASHIEKLKGRTHSPEAIEKNRVAHSGKKHAPESRAKISAALAGKPKSPEHIEKLRLAAKARFAIKARGE